MESHATAVSHRHPLFAALFATLALIALNFTSPFMAAPYIVWDLGGDNTISLYTIAVFGLGSALSIPLGKELIAHWHVRGILVNCTLLMALCTFLCGTAYNFNSYLTYRFLCGFAAGPMYSALNYSLRVLAAPEKKAAALSTFITILTVAPVVGAAIGGVIAYEYTWRWAHYLNIPFLIILAGGQYICFEDIDLGMKKSPFDWVAYLFFFIGTTCLSLCAILCQYLDWYRSDWLVALFLIGLPCFIFFILRCIYTEEPLLDLKMCKKPVFAFGLLCLAILFSAYFGMISLLGIWLKIYVNYTPYWIGLTVGTMALAGFIPKFLIGGPLSKIDPRISLGLAILFMTISCFHTTTFNVEIDFWRIAFSRTLAGFSLALFLPPIFRMCFESNPAEKSVDVIELFQVVRNLAAGLGAVVYNIVWQRRQVFFHERLGEQLTASYKGTTQFFTELTQLHQPGNRYSHLAYILDEQSTALGLEDTFWLMAWILVGLFALLLLTLKWTKLET
jgi:DHA2 family multidrug resistance protein